MVGRFQGVVQIVIPRLSEQLGTHCSDCETCGLLNNLY